MLIAVMGNLLLKRCDPAGGLGVWTSEKNKSQWLGPENSAFLRLEDSG